MLSGVAYIFNLYGATYTHFHVDAVVFLESRSNFVLVVFIAGLSLERVVTFHVFFISVCWLLLRRIIKRAAVLYLARRYHRLSSCLFICLPLVVSVCRGAS